MTESERLRKIKKLCDEIINDTSDFMDSKIPKEALDVLIWNNVLGIREQVDELEEVKFNEGMDNV